jgi:hypothetical protein
VRTRHPYPNKGWHVAHRRIGRKHVDGILLAFSATPTNFGVLAHWAMAGAEYLLSRRTMYTLLDHDLGAASDDWLLWGEASKETCGSPRMFKDRWPVWARLDNADNEAFSQADAGARRFR